MGINSENFTMTSSIVCQIKVSTFMNSAFTKKLVRITHVRWPVLATHSHETHCWAVARNLLTVKGTVLTLTDFLSSLRSLTWSYYAVLLQMALCPFRGHLLLDGCLGFEPREARSCRHKAYATGGSHLGQGVRE